MIDVASKNYVDAGADDDTILSYGNNNTINGGSGNDSILVSVYEGFGIKNEIRGGDGDDTISVTAVIESTVLGEAGNDFIHISEEANNNTILGGTGNDTITIDDADRNFIGYSIGDSSDTVFGFDSNDTLYIAEGDFSKSTIGSDVLVSIGDGSILLKDAAGKDFNVIKPLTFDDLFKGMQQNKVIFGTQQNDTLSTTDDEAIVDAGDGDDLIYNYVGANTYIDCGAGNDSVQSNIEGITIDGGAGADSIRNYAGNGIIFGGTGNDSVYNSGSNIEINGGEGEDYIENRSHAVTIAGDEGSDSISNTVNFVTIDAGAGNNTIYSSGDNVSITAGAGNDTITNNGSNVTINASAGDDTIINNWSSENVLLVYNASDGNDFISGFKANSTLQLISATVDKISSDTENIFLVTGNDTITLSGAFDLGSINVVDEDGSKIELPGLEINATEEVEFIGNSWNNATINGVADDTIRINNKGSDVLINVESGNDSVQNHGEFVTISSGAGDDSIHNWSGGNNTSINGDVGNDYIENYGEFVTISGGDGDDTVSNDYSWGSSIGGDNASISGGAGNDSIDNSATAQTLR